MMQMAVDEVINVVTVRNSGMPAIGAMHVPGGMSAALMVRRARTRIGTTHREFMFFDLAVGTLVMQMPVVQVVDMILMLDGRMAAICPVLVRMIFVHRRCHFALLCRQGTSSEAA
jgi:hypothetical protein